MTYVYEIKLNGVRRYVGITNNIKERIYRHNYNLRKGKEKDLYNEARSINITTLELEIIFENKSRVECKRYEALLILEDHFGNQDLYQKCPNISDR